MSEPDLIAEAMAPLTANLDLAIAEFHAMDPESIDFGRLPYYVETIRELQQPVDWNADDERKAEAKLRRDMHGNDADRLIGERRKRIEDERRARARWVALEAKLRTFATREMLYDGQSGHGDFSPCPVCRGKGHAEAYKLDAYGVRPERIFPLEPQNRTSPCLCACVQAYVHHRRPDIQVQRPRGLWPTESGVPLQL